MDSSPHSATSSCAAPASSHQGASMPPACHEQLEAPSFVERSSTSTRAPRSASSTAQVSPATPAPTTVTSTGLLSRWRGDVKLARFAELHGHFLHPLLANFR